MHTLTSLRIVGLEFLIGCERDLPFEEYLEQAKDTYNLGFLTMTLDQLIKLRDDAINHRIPLDIGKMDEIGEDEDGQWWWGGEFDSGDRVLMHPDTYVGFVVAAVNLCYGSEAWKRIYVGSVDL